MSEHVATKRRRRSSSPAVPRKKSCQVCRKAKARCSLSTPRCTRCEKKGFQCCYEGARNPDVSPPHHSTTAATTTSNSDEGAQAFVPTPTAGSNSEESSGLSSAEVQDDAEIDNVLYDGWLGPTSNSVVTKRDSSFFWRPAQEEGLESGWSVASEQGYRPSATVNKLTSRLFVPRVHKGPDLGFYLSTNYDAEGKKQITMVPSLSTYSSVGRFFNFQARGTAAFVLGANYIVGVMKTYPRMMHGNTMPPFIHASCPSLRCDADDACVPRPTIPKALENCIGICNMFFAKTTASSPLVWKTIKMEQERLYDQYKGYGPQGLVLALQAMMIYTLLRIIDGPHPYNDFDIALLITCGEMGAMSYRFNSVLSGDDFKRQKSWSEWLLSETSRRVMITFWLMSILFDLDRLFPETPECIGFDGIPLPSAKALWLAESKVEWEHRYGEHQARRKGTKILTYGDLRLSKDPQASGLSSGDLDDLKDWCADVDDLGALILISALTDCQSSATSVYPVPTRPA